MKRANELPPIARRGLLAGAGAVGALGAAAALLPGPASEPAAAAEPQRKADAAAAPGYRLTEHIERYYRTARI